MTAAATEDARKVIEMSAHRLFLQNGYHATSYQHIADAVERERTLVQYHFPKKHDLAIGLIARLLAELEAAIDMHALTDRDPYRFRYAMARLYLSFFAQEGVRAFALDIFSSRQLTGHLLAQDLAWNSEFLRGEGIRHEGDEEHRHGDDDVIIAVGGAYELVYWCLSRNQAIDTDALARRILHNVARAPDAVDLRLEGIDIGPHVVEQIITTVTSTLVTSRPVDEH